MTSPKAVVSLFVFLPIVLFTLQCTNNNPGAGGTTSTKDTASITPVSLPVLVPGLARAGDLALLVAMHVTTKEINNWTWQTYYWAPDPENPRAPSSKIAARLRPAQLQGAAAHYALVTAYVEVLPDQPLSGGTNKGVSAMIGYNPYLEAGFGPADLNYPNKFNPSYVYGIQSNCMSCHTLATIDGQVGYSADQYISNEDPVFKNRVRLDFAWSIQQAIIKDK